ncbi:MAG: outer membrane protein assembly factor BamB family protein [Candidatus Xenobia bacterium]
MWRKVALAALVAAVPVAAKPLASILHQTAPHDFGEPYAKTALADEQRGRWLGAISAWRSCVRLSPGDGPQALQHLYDLAGVKWMAPIPMRDAQPLQIGRDVIAVTKGPVVTGVDRTTGRAIWTLQNAIAWPYHGDLAVFVQDGSRVTRIEPKTNRVMWEVALHGPANQAVVGIHEGTAVLQGDSWPMAVSMETGKVLWGPARESAKGYRSMCCDRGVLVWPQSVHPTGAAQDQWQQASMVLLDYRDGHTLWTRPMVAGEPWRVSVDATHAYLSDPNLSSEMPWTAVSLDTGRTVWKQRLEEARPSTLYAAGRVLVESADPAPSESLHFLDPATGRAVWGCEAVSAVVPNGPVLEAGSNGQLTAHDLNTGNVMWTMPAGEAQIDPSNMTCGTALTFHAQAPGPMSGAPVPGAVAVDPLHGHVQWTQWAHDEPYIQQWHVLAAAGTQVMVESDRTLAHPMSSLLALDAARGNIVWGLSDFTPVPTAPPTRVDNTLYVLAAERDGATLYAFDLAKISELTQRGRRWWW